MRLSVFWTLMEDEFGAPYAASLAHDHVLLTLGDRTVEQALAAGLPPRDVWDAVCEALQVPLERRLGVEPRPRR